jgi:hypothetical protein
MHEAPSSSNVNARAGVRWMRMPVAAWSSVGKMRAAARADTHARGCLQGHLFPIA